MKVLLVADFVTYKDGVQEMGLIQACKNLGLDYTTYQPLIQPDGLLFEEYDLVIHGVQYGTETRRIMDLVNAKKQVMYFCDYRREYDHLGEWEKQAKYLDMMFISNKEHVEKFRDLLNIPVYFLPQAAYIQDRLLDIPYKYDVLFIGLVQDNEFYSKRTKFINSIKADIEIINGGDSIEKNDIWKEMPILYRESKIVLDISAVWDAPGYVSGRFFHACGYGAAVLSKRFPGYKKFGYKEGVHKLFFDTPAEATKKIKTYLKRIKDLERIRQAGYLHTAEQHTYTNRLKFMLSKI